jgi:hypothetical protein
MTKLKENREKKLRKMENDRNLLLEEKKKCDDDKKELR